MRNVILKAKVVYSIGFVNILRLFFYRVQKQFFRLNAGAIQQVGRFFDQNDKSPPVIFKKNENILFYFGWYHANHNCPPNWHLNFLNDVESKHKDQPWNKIPDFDNEIGDIKTIWEPSRFEWVVILSQHAASGNKGALEKLNSWLNEWLKNNPCYFGANWKCGQEASIRVMHLAVAANILEQLNDSTDSLQQLILGHLERISSTVSYALAQDNNHGTSEAAALFIGGSWLLHLGNQRGLKFQKDGRKWLENRASHLIETDGTFSQQSVNYHRVLLDTYSMAEHFRRAFELPKFSDELYQRLQSAVNWLFQMVQLENGDAPNLGANDGARLLPLTDTDYRDYRPAVQLASVLFCNERAYDFEADLDLALKWLKIEIPKSCKPRPQSFDFQRGGFSVLRAGSGCVLFNIPRYRFRPSQADALHVDLWLKGQNLLRDGGSYSYNSGDEFLNYFGGTESHNTVQFDDRNQMPSLSRFLLGAWLKAENVIPVSEQNGTITTGAGYHDHKGAQHHRVVQLSADELRVVDEISGFMNKAILRWRLLPGDWEVLDNVVSNGKQSLRVTSDVPLRRFNLIEGWESRYYLKKTPLPVLEVEVNEPCTLVTEFSF